MRNILVPTDFSDTSRNAAKFAVQLGASLGEARIILYNMFERFEAGSDSSPLNDEIEDRRAIRLVALNNICKEVDKPAGIQIECRAEDGNNLVDGIQHMVASEMIDLLVMGITGATRIEQILVGSNTLRMLRNAICPMLVIPPEASFQPVQAMAFASDLTKDTDSLPWPRILSILDMFHPRLHVVHVQNGKEGITPEQAKEKEKLMSRLGKYQPEFHMVEQNDFIHAINQFAIDNEVEMLLTVPGKISYLSDLFRNTHSEKLGYYSYIPFVAIHE